MRQRTFACAAAAAAAAVVLATAAAAVQVDSPACKGKDDTGKEYDFSPLYNATGQYSTKLAGSPFKFVFNVCGAPVTDAPTKCDDTGAWMCLFECLASNGCAFEAVLGKWEAGASGVQWTTAPAPDGSPILETDNGVACPGRGTPVVSTLEFNCDEDNEVGDISVEHVDCTYSIKFGTKLACKDYVAPGQGNGNGNNGTGTGTGNGNDNGKPHKSGGGGGLSGGWVFVIILLCCAVVYVAAGCVFNSQRGATSMSERFPNSSFWGDLPSLVSEGCAFTVAKVRACMGGGGSAAPNYNEF